jgi:IS1 family transposase
MCNFVKKKANKRWLWLTMDIAFHVDNHRRDSAGQLWANLLAVYRKQAMFYMDQYEVYTGVIPAERHKASMEKARTTHYIKRFHNTLR